MGILANAVAIASGSILGSIFKKKIVLKNMSILGISVMIISIIGFLENILIITETGVKSENTVLVVLALIVGTLIGEKLHLESRLGELTNTKTLSLNGLTDATLFFGIGGMQICGPVLLGVGGDSSQLYLKALIDFPFALMFGTTYGKMSALASVPVALMQVLIAVAAYFAGSFLSDSIIEQLCAIGYVILFFSGMNLVCDRKHKINNINMLPGVLVIIVYHLALQAWRWLT